MTLIKYLEILKKKKNPISIEGKMSVYLVKGSNTNGSIAVNLYLCQQLFTEYQNPQFSSLRYEMYGICT